MKITKTHIVCYSALVIGIGLFYMVFVEGFTWRYFAEKKAVQILSDVSTAAERKEASGRFGMSAEYNNGDWIIIYYERHNGFRTSKSLGLALDSDGIWYRSDRDYHWLFRTAQALKRGRDAVKHLVREGHCELSELSELKPYDRNGELSLSILESPTLGVAREHIKELGFIEFDPK